MVYGQTLELPITALDPRHVYLHKFKKLRQDLGKPVAGQEVEIRDIQGERRQCYSYNGQTYVLYLGTISNTEGLYKIGCSKSPSLSRREFFIKKLGAKRTFIWADKSIVFQSRPIDLNSEMKASHYLRLRNDEYYYNTDLETKFLTELPFSFRPSKDRILDILNLDDSSELIKHAGLSEMFIWKCNAVNEIARMRKTRDNQIFSIIETIRFSQHKQRPHKGRIRLAYAS